MVMQRSTCVGVRATANQQLDRTSQRAAQRILSRFATSVDAWRTKHSSHLASGGDNDASQPALTHVRITQCRWASKIAPIISSALRAWRGNSIGRDATDGSYDTGSQVTGAPVQNLVREPVADEFEVASPSVCIRPGSTAASVRDQNSFGGDLHRFGASHSLLHAASSREIQS